MSAYANQIIAVVGELKKDILERLDANKEVTREQIDSITRGIFKECAKNFGVTESTIADKCTRKMKLNTYEFYQSVKQYILNESDIFVEKVVVYMPNDENEFYVRRALQEAKDK